MDDAVAGHGDGVPQTLILEEVNQLRSLFRTFWERNRPTGARIGAMPAAEDLAAIVHQGAQFSFRVLADGQDLKDGDVFGSRRAFGTRLIAGFTVQQWAYVIGTKPAPADPGRKG